MDTLVQLERRLIFLEKEEREFVQASARQKRQSEQMFSQLHEQLVQIRQSVSKMKTEIAAAQDGFRDVVKELRRTVSKTDIEVVERKMQKFSPENLFPAKDFRQMLQKEF